MAATNGYAYRAVRGNGTVARGTLDAASSADAFAALERIGLLAIDVTLVASPRDRRREIPAADLALGLRLLADVLEAGLPVSRALQTLADLAPPSWTGIMPHLRQAVREGKSLGAALRDAPAEIPALVVGMTMAGEMAGNVGGAVRRAADVTESMAETRAAIHNALAYPALLAVTGAGAIGVMVGVVIPRFAVILGDLSQKLPPSTRLVLDLAAIVKSAAVPAFMGAAVVAVALRAWTGTEEGRRRAHALLLRLPLIGPIRRASATARATVTLATLLETGVPVRQAIVFAARACGDATLAVRITEAGKRVESGQSISSAMRESDALTPLALRLVQAGEESGRLAAMLRHAAKLEQERSDRITRTAVRLLEPALILTFAGIVALVAAALLQAVYAVRPTA